MDHLPQEVIAHIGSFMDQKTRKNCMGVCKTMMSINYTYEVHTIIIENNINLQSHIPYIKHIKPLIADIYVTTQSFDVDVNTLASIHQMAQLANQTFSGVKIHVVVEYDCTTQFAISFISAFRDWQIHELTLTIEKNESFSNELVQLLTSMSWTSSKAGIVLTLMNEQTSVLTNPSLAKLVCNSVVMVSKHIPIIVDLSHMEHATVTVQFLGSGVNECTIISAQHISRLWLGYILTTTAEHLCRIFTGVDSTQLKLKAVWMVDLLGDSDDEWPNMLRTLKNLLPDTSKYFYSGKPHNAWTYPTLLKLREIADVGICFYESMDEYLMFRVIQRLIPGIEYIDIGATCQPPSCLNDPWRLQYKPSMTLSQLYDLMSPSIQQVWHWLPYIDEHMIANKKNT